MTEERRTGFVHADYTLEKTLAISLLTFHYTAIIYDSVVIHEDLRQVLFSYKFILFYSGIKIVV